MANKLMIEVDKCMFMQGKNGQVNNMQSQVDQLARIAGKEKGLPREGEDIGVQRQLLDL